MEDFRALVLSYKNTPLEIREMVSMETDSSDFLINLKDSIGIEEAMLVSTCNRTDIYFSSKDNVEGKILSAIAAYKGINKNTLEDHFQKLGTKQATNHLFRVALGLESRVLGDIQISNQVKRAYQQSADINLAGPFLHRLMHTIFYANKRVVQETQLQDGAASVASVAVNLIDQFVSTIENPRVALVGLGEIGQNTLENLNKEDIDLTIVNRTRSKAEKIAEEQRVSVGDFENLKHIISENDVIISAVSAKKKIINSDSIPKNTLRKLFIDLSVPRSIDQDIESFGGIALYNVDQLNERTEKAKSLREQAIPHVEAIISEALSGFDTWRSEMEVSPTIQRLKQTLEKIRREELARYSKVSDSEMKLLEVATKNMVQKVIKLPVLHLKAACKRGEAETLVGVLNDLFNLEAQEVENK